MSNVALIDSYFPQLNPVQQHQFSQLKELYEYWNERINVISRKDVNDFYEHHVLHSLAIAKIISFKSGSEIMDLGTGGGFPGIPLAIFFPEVQFLLVDSIGKKIKVIEEVKKALNLKNVVAKHTRAEEIKQQFDFIVTRAVAPVAELALWTKGKLKVKNNHSIPNALIALKGGDLTEELKGFEKKTKQYEINKLFSEPFFETKKIVLLSA